MVEGLLEALLPASHLAAHGQRFFERHKNVYRQHQFHKLENERSVYRSGCQDRGDLFALGRSGKPMAPRRPPLQGRGYDPVVVRDQENE